MGDREDEQTSHVHSLPSDYVDVQDRSYDPDYISQISLKMQVPDHISVDNGGGGGGGGGSEGVRGSGLDFASHRQFAHMQVPDRIIIAGDNQHIGLREGLRQFPMDGNFHSMETSDIVELGTPPRVLTLEQRFPFVDQGETRESRRSQDRQLVANGHLAAPVPYSPSTKPHDSLLLNEEDEATLLRTQVAKLTRRITSIEQDTQRRAQREMGLYVALFGYALWKMVFSFLRR